MQNEIKITDLQSYLSIDPVTDVIPIVDVANDVTKKITRNNYLGLSSNPVGISDSQTLTNKTLTNPTINSGVLSGTFTGTYTLGGTPTFPSSVVTTTGVQTLTNKTLTNPTINGGTIDNSTITVDAISGHTTANSGTIYGVAVASAKINGTSISNGTITAAQIGSGAVTSPKITLTYGFSAYSVAAQNTGNSAFAKVNFASEEYDISSNYNAGTSTFTAPVTAYYHFSAVRLTSIDTVDARLEPDTPAICTPRFHSTPFLNRDINKRVTGAPVPTPAEK